MIFRLSPRREPLRAPGLSRDPRYSRARGQCRHFQSATSLRQVLHGAVGVAPSVHRALRTLTYANWPVKNLPGVKSRFENVDIVLVRENTEDLYSGLEHEVVPAWSRA